MKTNLTRFKKERLPRKLKKHYRKIMSKEAFHSLMGWNDKFFGDCKQFYTK